MFDTCYVGARRVQLTSEKGKQLGFGPAFELPSEEGPTLGLESLGFEHVKLFKYDVPGQRVFAHVLEKKSVAGEASLGLALSNARGLLSQGSEVKTTGVGSI